MIVLPTVFLWFCRFADKELADKSIFEEEECQWESWFDDGHRVWQHQHSLRHFSCRLSCWMFTNTIGPHSWLVGIIRDARILHFCTRRIFCTDLAGLHRIEFSWPNEMEKFCRHYGNVDPKFDTNYWHVQPALSNHWWESIDAILKNHVLDFLRTWSATGF